MVATETGLDALLGTPLKEGKKWSVFLEIDCGYGRSELKHVEFTDQSQKGLILYLSADILLENLISNVDN